VTAVPADPAAQASPEWLTGGWAGVEGVELIIVGAGGFARETASSVAAVNEAAPGTWKLLGFLDDDPALTGTTRDGVTILGPVDSVADWPDARVVVCVGNPRNYAAREAIVARLALPAERYATVIHPSVSRGDDCVIAPGSVLLAQVVLTAGVTVGAHVAVMPQVVLTHDDRIDDFATIASGVRLGGGVTIGRGAYVGAGALVRESTTVGAWSLVGLGSVVLSDIPAGEVWAGNPARHLRQATPAGRGT
jgi:sugar O-acyltransferase (sialic acid O-acetyltransferase NeuD family)